MGIKSVLFDLDGTLIDSETAHFDSWNELLSPFSIQLDLDFYLKEFAGVSLPANAERLVGLYGLNSSVQSLVEQREKIHIDRLTKHETKFMPHAKETIEFFHSKNFALGLVTSSSRSEVDIFLTKSGMGNYFKSVVTRDDVTKYKPDPEPYELSAKSLGHLKSEYVVFEDSFSGLTSAKAAGLTCYAIQSYEPERKKLRELADRMFNDLSEVMRLFLDNHIL